MLKTNAIGIHQFSQVKGLLLTSVSNTTSQSMGNEVGTAETIALKITLSIASSGIAGEDK